MKKKSITVEASVTAGIENIWELWNEPKHIKKWYHASDDWFVPKAENNPKVGGRFKIAMAAKDKSAGFDFEGTYSSIEKYRLIEYTIDGGRKVKITFEKNGKSIKVKETFETENTNPEEMQRAGWQAILDNFKKYAEKYIK